MKIKVVVTASVIDKLWAMGACGRAKMLPDGKEGIIEISEDVVSEVIDIFDTPTFSGALERLIDANLFSPEGGTPQTDPPGANQPGKEP